MPYVWENLAFAGIYAEVRSDIVMNLFFCLLLQVCGHCCSLRVARIFNKR